MSSTSAAQIRICDVRNGNIADMHEQQCTTTVGTCAGHYEGLSDDYEPFERQVAGHKLTLHVRDPATVSAYKLKKTSLAGTGGKVTTLGMRARIV
jgi:hypothetical protein